MAETKWTPILCGLYEVSDDGRVFSVGTNWRGYGRRELVSQLNTYGYPKVRLKVGGRRMNVPVHRLVAEAFLGPKPTPQHQIRHLDGDKANNRISNLAWGTAKENAEDRDRHGRTSNGWRADTVDREAFRRRCAEGAKGRKRRTA